MSEPEFKIGDPEQLRTEMEQISAEARDLVVTLPPVQLLGHLLSQFHLAYMGALDLTSDTPKPDRNLAVKFQFALEFVHAVWCCHSALPNEDLQLDTTKAAEVLPILERLKGITLSYCFASSVHFAGESHDPFRERLQYEAKTTWVLIRGNRYQVLEREFFEFVLRPHSDALIKVYNMDFSSIASSIQAIVDATRMGIANAFSKIREEQKRSEDLANEKGLGLEEAVALLREQDPEFATKMAAAIDDLFMGGIFNLSKHTKFTHDLLVDLSYEPGENKEFFADGDLKGTPLRTLPARVKPAIRLNGQFYIADAQFIRDSAYRAIQRGLLRRLPEYREEWNRRQKALVEWSFVRIFEGKLKGAKVFTEVFYRDAAGNWAEADLVIQIDDVLLIIEAKAGVTAMQSPVTNFEQHERAVNRLIVNAYEQCDRFLRYIGSAQEVPIYKRENTEFVEFGRLRLSEFRTVLPIGLTIEAFTPFSAMSKEIPGITPILGVHHFISMSVDDLFVINRILPTAGQLMHYFQVRQSVASIRNASLFDEIDHLGAYVTKNRFDLTIKDQFASEDAPNFIVWDMFSEVIDDHFQRNDWETKPVPGQDFSEEIGDLLQALDERRPKGWLAIDSHIRDLGSDARDNLANFIRELKQTLAVHPFRHFTLLGDNIPLQTWVCNRLSRPNNERIRDQAQIGCLLAKTPTIDVVMIAFDQDLKISDLQCWTFSAPTIIQANFPMLKVEATRQSARFIDLRSKVKPGQRKMDGGARSK